ncbi:MAG: protein-L-isoaspartate(D-aspartate) O-methyltransferase [Candidatus Hydrogenedentes bacterium]|nr:protein-L-isoaspartate(D-aspartate) O-methyltransferase [Candidatus Hydrogenedentota bacterium]
MDDFDAQRNAMVERQLAARNITSPRVLTAMRNVPRHCFVPLHLRDQAYEDRPLEIGHGQTISQPYMVAYMTQLLDLRPTDRVLEIGTGSGYQAAILGSLAQRVVTMERIESIGLTAAHLLCELGYGNIAVHVADGTLGWLDEAPYDAIIVTAAGPSVPDALKAQLADGGRLVCPAGPRDMQRLVRVTRQAELFREEESIACVFVPLIGSEGWPV